MEVEEKGTGGKVVVGQAVAIVWQSGSNFTATMRSNPPQDTCPRAVSRLHKSMCRLCVTFEDRSIDIR